MKKWLPYLLLTFLIVSGFTVMNLLYQKSHLSSRLQSCRLGRSDLQKALQSMSTFKWSLEGSRVEPYLTVTDMYGMQVSFDSLLLESNNELIVLRFLWDTCSDCQIQEMKFLQTLENKQNIAIITTFDSFKDFILYMKSTKIDLPAYYLPRTDKMFNNINEEQNSVFCLLVGAERKVSMVHLASSSFPKISEEYYSILKRRFSQKLQ